MSENEKESSEKKWRNLLERIKKIATFSYKKRQLACFRALTGQRYLQTCTDSGLWTRQYVPDVLAIQLCKMSLHHRLQT